MSDTITLELYDGFSETEIFTTIDTAALDVSAFQRLEIQPS